MKCVQKHRDAAAGSAGMQDARTLRGNVIGRIRVLECNLQERCAGMYNVKVSQGGSNRYDLRCRGGKKEGLLTYAGTGCTIWVQNH